jgi:hypothetical protein
MDELTVRRRVREMVTTGALPCEDPASLWGGMGDGKRCAACAEPIRVGEVEFEAVLASGWKILLHRPCYVIWIEECQPGPATPEGVAPSTP